MIICLSAEQQTIVLNAIAPMQQAERNAFLLALTQLLAGRTTVGNGQLYRMIRDLQREFFKPPDVRGDDHQKAHRGRP
jgi:hypothetical protein